jgi:hypothetical protein
VAPLAKDHKAPNGVAFDSSLDWYDNAWAWWSKHDEPN